MTDIADLLIQDVEILTVGPVTGVIPGPQGEQGEPGPPGPVNLVVSPTEPVAADYDAVTIPVGAVWIQSPE